MRIADWAVLIYSGPSREIEAPARASLEEVARAQLPDGVVVGAQLAGQGQALRYGFGAGCTGQPERVGPVDMSQPSSLRVFLDWGRANFPARHYAVVVGGHGAGFLGAVSDPERHRLMPLDELARALGQARPEMVVFNCCLMAQAEVACELGTGYLVASQGQEKGLGMPLGRWLEGLHAGDSPAQAADQLKQACRGAGERSPLVSAVPIGESLTPDLDRVGQALLQAPDKQALSQDLEAVPGFWDKPWDHPLSDYKDLGQVLRGWEQDPRAGAQLREACHQLLQGCPEGLSIYAPRQRQPAVEKTYGALKLARNTHWEEGLHSLWPS